VARTSIALDIVPLLLNLTSSNIDRLMVAIAINVTRKELFQIIEKVNGLSNATKETGFLNG